MRLVVPSERHVERLARDGELAETRSALQRRLVEVLAPQVKLAPPEATRLALAEALRTVAWEDELLLPLATAGSLAWLRTVDAVDEAIAMLRASNTPLSSLEKAEHLGGGLARRAAMLRRAMVALDALLVRAQGRWTDALRVRCWQRPSGEPRGGHTHSRSTMPDAAVEAKGNRADEKPARIASGGVYGIFAGELL